ncbi:MAG: TIGR01777 family oxidoreductase [Marmoricola sp.]
MRYLIAGSSGFLGTQLRQALAGGDHHVVRLVRGTPDGPDQRRWNPYGEPLEPDVLDDVDVVVNLAGVSIAGNPHSRKWAHAVEESRVVTTRTLASAIAIRDPKPVFLAGNGISYYGDHGVEVLDETADSRGDSLLTRVSRVWQDAAQPAADAGARVCFLRTAPVMDRRSPPMKMLLPLFRLGLGGPLGDGRQYFPVVSTEDWVRAAIFCAEHTSVDGPVNLCLPEVPTNQEFTEALGKAVGRPTIVRVPSLVIRPAAGAMAPEVLGSVRATPKALLDAGFAFRADNIAQLVETALSAGL